MYARKKSINLIFQGTGKELNAWIDRNKIDSILHNLISNALKYTPNGGTVSVILQNNTKYWFIEIADTGIGISSKDQKKLFKRLFRGENPPKGGSSAYS